MICFEENTTFHKDISHIMYLEYIWSTHEFPTIVSHLIQHKLYANFDESNLYQRKIQYFGHVISKDVIAVDP